MHDSFSLSLVVVFIIWAFIHFLGTCFHFLITDNALINSLWQWDYTCLLMYIYQACPFLILPNIMVSLVAHMVKGLPGMRETQIWSLVGEDPLEKEMATHSSILAWRILWTDEPGRLQSMGSKESDTTEQLSAAQHDISRLLICLYWRILAYLEYKAHLIS